MVHKKKLAQTVASKTLLTQKEAMQVMDTIFDGIIDLAEKEGEVSIVGFGKFYLYSHSPRPVRNPRTGEEMILKPYNSIKFKPSHKIKKRLKDSE